MSAPQNPALAVTPPSTTNSAPVQYDESSLARNATTDATSSASPIRLSPATFLPTYLRPSSSITARVIGVSMPPGCTELQRILSAPYSIAATLVMPRTPNLLAVYAPQNTVPASPSVEEMLTIEPPPARFIAGMTVFIPRKTPIRLTSMTCRNSSRGVLAISLNFRMPALLTSTSTLPSSRSVCSTTDCHSSSDVTSRCTKRTRSPSSSASALPSSSSPSAATTLAPSACSRRTSAAPIPRAPPLTSATLPVSRPATPVPSAGFDIEALPLTNVIV